VQSNRRPSPGRSPGVCIVRSRRSSLHVRLSDDRGQASTGVRRSSDACKKSGACSARVVDLGDEIEEAGKVSELTVEAQGGITVNTDTKDGDSGAGIEA